MNDTPMHPEYPSQAAIINGVAVGVLESVFGPKPAIPFTTADLFDPNLKRQFTSIAELAITVTVHRSNSPPPGALNLNALSP